MGQARRLGYTGCGRKCRSPWVCLLEHSDYARNYAAENVPELAVGVRPQLRGQGIGTALMEALIDVTRGRSPAIVLSMRTSNPALRLYARLGFVVVEEIANRVGTASVVMVWKEKDQ